MRYVYYLFIVFSFLSCNEVCKGETGVNVIAVNIQTNSETDTLTPVSIESEEYRFIQKGKYQPKSTNAEFIKGQNTEIETFWVTNRSFVETPACMYLANEVPIALFKNKNPETIEDVVGILKNSTLVEVDTVFYNAVFIDSEEAPMSFDEWFKLLEEDSTFSESKPLTYDVWYAIKINGKKYYTDYKLHNYIEYQTYIPFREQIFLICSQGTGYDGGYDRGYPDFYEVVVLGKPDLKEDKWIQILNSPKLDMNNKGADEYGIGDYLTEESVVIEPEGYLTISFDSKKKLIWNGEILQIDSIKQRTE